MAYGLWLYKEIQGKHLVRLEIKKRDYQGQAIEIDALGKDSITLSMDGSNITDNIIGSTLSFAIIDSGQINTSDFFTPDATLYAVELYLDGTLHWSGYLTPDSYAENLSYRDTISLIARDNLGRLNDFTFEVSRGLMNIEELFESLLDEVGCPQYLNWSVYKVATAKGNGVSQVTDIRSMSVNTMLFVGKTYREAMESILYGLGCQMRFRGLNNLLILNLSDLSTIQDGSAIFIEKSGHKEILPAWKNVTITQDYGLIENFFDGVLTEKESGSSTFYNPSEQVPTKWEGNLNFQNQYGWNTGIEDNQQESIYPALHEEDQDVLNGNYRAIYKTPIKATNATLSITMSLNNTLRRLRNVVFNSVSNLFVPQGKEKYQITFSFQVALRTPNGKVYIMTSNDWVDGQSLDFNHSFARWIKFLMPECVMADEGTWNKEQEVSIFVNSIPYDGELLLYIYPILWGEDGTDDGYSLAGKIRDIKIAFSNDIGQQSARVTINDKHNITSEIALTIGQVPSGKGDYKAYAGGLFASDGLPIYGFKRRESDIISYNLMELVGREHIHYNKDNYPILSGRMMGDISFGNNIAYKGRKYTLISASYSVISGILDVTSMQEVRDYQVAELTIIDSPLESTSGSRVGSGNNEVIQFSNDAGNAKRLYELQDAIEQDQEGAYIIIDKSSMDSAKRLPISAIGGFFEEDENRDIRLKDKDGQGKRNLTNIGKLEMGKLILPTENEEPSNYALYVGELGAGADTPEGGGGSVNGLSKVNVFLGAGTTPYSTDAMGDVVLPAYPTTLPASDVSAWAKAATKPTYTASEVGALSTSGGTIKGDLSLNQYLRINAWSGYGSGSANVWYNGTTQRLLWENVADMAFGSKLVLHSENYSSYALPLSGGKISDTTKQHILTINSGSIAGTYFIIENNDIYKAAIGWNSTDGVFFYNRIADKLIGITNSGTPFFSDGKQKELIHTGNYSTTTDKRYLQLSGGTISGDICLNYDLSRYSRIIFKDNRIYTSGYADSIIVVNDGNDSSVGSIGLYGSINGVNYYYFGHNSYDGDNLRIYSDKLSFGDYTLIHSGNIKDYNAGSATKLRTARTIWGQSFDGTKSVDGNFYMAGEVVSLAGDLTGGNTNAASPKLWLGAFHPEGNRYTGSYIQSIGDSGYGNHTISFFTKHSNDYTTAPVERMRITSEGNVLIGTATDNGGKLQVEGDININGIIRPRANWLGLTNEDTTYTLGTSTYAWGTVYTRCIDTYQDWPLVIKNNGVAKVYIGTNYIRSAVDGETTLGTANYRWNILYGKTADFKGAVTIYDGMFRIGVNTLAPDTTTKGFFGFQFYNDNLYITTRLETNAFKANVVRFEHSTGNVYFNNNISASGYQLPTSAPSNPVSGGYYLYVGTLGAGATIS